MRKMNKKGQVAILIIFGLMLVIVLFLLWFLLRGGEPEITEISIDNPKNYLRGCISDAISEGLKKVQENGGNLEPKKTIYYEGKNVTYLCYNKKNYMKCINQNPMIISSTENEIYNYSRNKIEVCFNSLLEDLREDNFEVKSFGNDLDIEIIPGKIRIDMGYNLRIEKEDAVQNYKGFIIDIKSPLWDFLNVANEIVNQEAQFCGFNLMGYNILYPQTEVYKTMTYDSTKIYTIKRNEDSFRFAIRGCGMPAGL